VTDEARKEAERFKLLADGWEPEDLTWTPPGAAIAVELVYLRGQDEAEELRKALDRAQADQEKLLALALPGSDELPATADAQQETQ
jgi:hypothetical protein